MTVIEASHTLLSALTIHRLLTWAKQCGGDTSDNGFAAVHSLLVDIARQTRTLVLVLAVLGRGRDSVVGLFRGCSGGERIFPRSDGILLHPCLLSYHQISAGCDSVLRPGLGVFDGLQWAGLRPAGALWQQDSKAGFKRYQRLTVGNINTAGF